MPSQCRWIFDWCFRDAFVKLHGVKAVERNKLILTDGDSQMYSPLVDLANDGQSPWRNSRHMLCMWHLINRGLKHQHLSDGRLSPLGKAQFGAVQNWMYSLSDSPETSEEFDLSLRLLYTFLGSDEVLDPQAMGNVMAEALTNFIMTSIAPKKTSIAFFVKLHLRCFNMRTTSNVESESSTIKRHPLGPRPFHGIDRSCAALSNILSSQMKTREVDAACAMDSKNICQHLGGDSLTDRGASLLSDQYYARLGYIVSRINFDTFLLKKRIDEHHNHGDVSYQYHVLPHFARVREIKIVERFSNSPRNEGGNNDRMDSGLLCLVCSCGYFSRFGITCRHVYAVLAPQNDHAANPPSTDDATVSWRKDYLHYHSRDEKLTALYDKARDNEAPGVFTSKEYIDQLWQLTGNRIDFQQFLTQHNQTSKSTILSGTKWNPRTPISSRSIGTEDDSGLPLSTNVRTSITAVQEEDDSVLLLGGCSQEINITAVNVKNAASLLAHDGHESLTGAAEDGDDDSCWDQQQQVHSQNMLGRSVYASNLSLYTQVANFAQRDAGMALDLRRGLEQMLFKFIQQKNKGETANTSEHEFASLPHVDTSRRNKRLRPALSPEKRFKGNTKKF